jgi:hypothetical protein
MARQQRPWPAKLSPMNKNALLAVVAALFVALGALWWTTLDNAPSATPGAEVEQAAGPASMPAVAADAVRSDEPASLELAEDSDAAPQDTRAAARPSREPVWLEVLATLPAGVPSDEQAEVVVLHGADLESREGRAKAAELRSALDTQGRARIEIPAGVAELRVELRARYLYIEQELELRAPFERVELAPKLGAWLSATLVLPQPLPADVDLTQVAPFALELRGFDMDAMRGGGGGHTVDRPLDSRERFEVGGLRPKLNYFLSVDPQVFVHVRDLELRGKAGEHVHREYVVELGARVRGTVRDAAGAPLAGVMVRSTGRAGWMNGAARAATTDAQGAYDLRGLAAEKMYLSAQSANHLPGRSEEFEVRNGETAQVDLQLESGASLNGVVRFPDGSPAAGADVLCIDATGERGSGGFKALKADDQGRFEFTALDGENYRLRATRIAARDPNASEASEEYEWSRVQRDAAPGATVELVLAPPHRVLGRVSDTSGEPVTKFSISHRWWDGPRNFAPSGEVESADGAFELWLGAGEHVVFARAKGFEMVPDGVKLETPGNASPIEIVMRRQAAISGLVTHPDGAPATGARVEVQASRGRGSNRATTDENGRFALDQVSAGVHKLVAKAEGFAPSEAASVEVVAGQALEGVNLVLRIGGRVEGVIYDASGAPDEGRSIVVGAMTGGMGDLAGQATSDSAGRFVLEHVAPGTHSVVATPRMNALRGEQSQAELMASLKMTSIEVLDGQTTQIVLGAPPAAPVRLSGRVTRGGEPMREGMVTAVADGGSLLESMKFGSLDKDGGYEFVLDKPGAYTLLVGRRMGDAAAEFFENIPAATEHRLDLELPSGAVRGRVVGPDGAPLSGIAVRHEREGVTSLSMFDMNRSATTDADGRFELSDLAPGLYTLRAGGGGGGFAGGRSSWGVAVRSGIEVKDSATPTQVELRLEAPGVIAGAVLDAEGRALPEASIFVRDSAGVLLNPFSSTRTDAQGKFRFEAAAPGVYSVSARASGAVSGESQSVRVSAGGVAEVELRAVPGTMLVLEIDSGSGAVVRTNVRVLDSAGRDHASMVSFDGLQSVLSGGASAAKRRIGPLAPGKYKVIVTPPGGASITKPVTLSGQAERALKVRLGE